MTSARSRSMYYEPLSRRAVSDEYIAVARRALGWTWEVTRTGPWFMCTPPQPVELQSCGWKLHISATIDNALVVLSVASAKCREHCVPFKFAADPGLYSLLNTKETQRGSSGKFITIYPTNDARFKQLLDDLYVALRGFNGPYILSDRRYRDCKALYYRYGTITPPTQVNWKGEPRHILLGPGGEEVEDVREPYFSPPPWVTDPFNHTAPVSDMGDPQNPQLNDNRYLVTAAMHFSNTGGVYEAIDLHTGEPVVIKEARPHVAARIRASEASSVDAVGSLHNEEFILSMLAPYTQDVPRVIDSFKEWEHYYLVLNRFSGLTAWDFFAREVHVFSLYSDDDSRHKHMQTVRKLWRLLLQGAHTMHENGVWFCDWSPRNLLVDVDDENDLLLHFIDFEAATTDHDLSEAPAIATPGFVSPQLRDGQPPSRADECYGVGACMLAMLFPYNATIHLDKGPIQPLLDYLAHELPVTDPEIAIIERMHSSNPDERADIMEALEVVEVADAKPSEKLIQRFRDRRSDVSSVCPSEGDLTRVIDQSVNELLSCVDVHRSDRLFPMSQAGDNTNPLSTAYGAMGILRALHLLGQRIPSELWAWVFQHMANFRYTAGLYVGKSGIAWAFADCDMVEAAMDIESTTVRNEPDMLAKDVFYGEAGRGLAYLRMWNCTDSEYYLRRAVRIGDGLVDSATSAADGVYWPDPDGKIACGYAHGSAGIGEFLVYLYAATRLDQYLETAERALEFEVKQLRAGRFGALGLPREAGSEDILYPYWEFGGAGLGSALLRYGAVSGNWQYREAVAGIAKDASIACTVGAGLFMGQAGLCDFLMDCYAFLGDESYLQDAHRMSRGIVSATISTKDNGCTFVEPRGRVAVVDFAAGNAGVALTLARMRYLLEGEGPIRTNFNYTLDDPLLLKWMV